MTYFNLHHHVLQMYPPYFCKLYPLWELDKVGNLQKNPKFLALQAPQDQSPNHHPLHSSYWSHRFSCFLYTPCQTYLNPLNFIFVIPSQTLTQLHQKLTCLWLGFRVEFFRLDGWTLLTVDCQASPVVPPPKNKSVFDSSTTAMGVHCSALQKTQLHPQSNWHRKTSP